MKIKCDSFCLPKKPGIVVSGFIVEDNTGKVIIEQSDICDFVKSVQEQISPEMDHLINLILRFLNSSGCDEEIYIEHKNPSFAKVFYETCKEANFIPSSKIRFVVNRNLSDVWFLIANSYKNFLEDKCLEKIGLTFHKMAVQKKDKHFVVDGFKISKNLLQCNCFYYKFFNDVSLLKDFNIIVKCKHILFLERFIKKNKVKYWQDDKKFS